MHQGPGQLLRQRRFGPFFATQFLGAFNDNVFKNALIILVTFQGLRNAGSYQFPSLTPSVVGSS
ncbi:hypothetical protein C8D92_1173 [Tamilnaduibacter salinus]|uniref:Uncharacterized protein n=1 Tax=Tamilnaduibacter salinus TaxID=1484056 RepID=A0A2U1CT83_9GAMM|nr:hypothetical protein [Tamilnaduibacter salinus]PVY69322.1 hypothetical protein C8D92_1173 [Tamilnaduibacter salinus]